MSSEWDWVDDELYAKKSTIYTFKPEIPVGIRANSVALANYGGPIALVPTKFSDGISDSRDDQGDTVRFYNSAGKLFPSKSAAPSGASAYPDSSLSLSRQMSDGDVSMEVVCVGWTRRQSLITVTRGGLAQIHRGPVDPEPHTVTLAEFQPGDVVQLAVIDGDCLALLTSSMQLFVSSNLHSEDPYCVRYPDPPLDPTRPPNDMLIMPIDMDTMYADEDVMEVMIPLYPSGVVLMTSSEAKGQLSEWNNSQIAVMSLHPGKEKVIVCTVDMKVSVLSLDFETTFLSVDVSDQIDGLLTPEGAGWVGGMEDDIDNGLVILTFESPPWCRGGGGALGISASGETVSWGINTGQGDALAMVQECDCVRIATAEEHVRIEVVPPSSVAMFTVASTDPVAMLKDAWDAFEKRDPNADEAVKLLVEAEQLDDAVEHCIEAALFESEKKMQVSLLSAAAYGLPGLGRQRVGPERAGEGGRDGDPRAEQLAGRAGGLPPDVHRVRPDDPGTAGRPAAARKHALAGAGNLRKCAGPERHRHHTLGVQKARKDPSPRHVRLGHARDHQQEALKRRRGVGVVDRPDSPHHGPAQLGAQNHGARAVGPGQSFFTPVDERARRRHTVRDGVPRHGLGVLYNVSMQGGPHVRRVLWPNLEDRRGGLPDGEVLEAARRPRHADAIFEQPGRPRAERAVLFGGGGQAVRDGRGKGGVLDDGDERLQAGDPRSEGPGGEEAHAQHEADDVRPVRSGKKPKPAVQQPRRPLAAPNHLRRGLPPANKPRGGHSQAVQSAEEGLQPLFNKGPGSDARVGRVGKARKAPLFRQRDQWNAAVRGRVPQGREEGRCLEVGDNVDEQAGADGVFHFVEGVGRSRGFGHTLGR